MAILAFQKPDKVVMLEVNDRFGKFEFRPLEPGFGITIGNSLRRILLSSLEGYAINTIRIAGVDVFAQAWVETPEATYLSIVMYLLLCTFLYKVAMYIKAKHAK